MNFDFDTPVNRRNTNSLKWEVGENELPMWVADMDFCTAPAVRAAVEKRALHGVFGYSDVTDAWYDAYCNWWQNRHGLQLDKSRLVFCTGVVPAISSIVRKLTTPAEKVLVLTPVYNIFFNSIINNGRQPLECELLFDGREYSIDFNDFEEKLSDPQTSLMILCNPHNPVGKIWSKDELAKIGELCRKHGVTVVSDEIHCDITRPGCSYTPFCAASKDNEKMSVTCIAPTKAFNFAGLQTAAVYVPDSFLCHKVSRGLNTDEVAEPNAFAVDTAVAAFNEGGDWLDALNKYVFENKDIVKSFVEKNISEINVVSSNATYLVWLDCTKLNMCSKELSAFIRKTTGLYLSSGEVYGKGGDRFLRMNVACPKSSVNDGLLRLKKAVELLKNEK